MHGAEQATILKRDVLGRVTVTREQREAMFVAEALGGDAKALTPALRERLAQLDQLCLGDFAAVQRQAQILAETLDAEAFMAQLEAEHRIKPEVRERRRMGFTH